MVVQELKARDYVQREDFTVRMQVVFEGEEKPIILLSDEAHLQLNVQWTNRTAVIGHQMIHITSTNDHYKAIL